VDAVVGPGRTLNVVWEDKSTFPGDVANTWDVVVDVFDLSQ
jgi:hypothetical protein